MLLAVLFASAAAWALPNKTALFRMAAQIFRAQTNLFDAIELFHD
jgi:hypothetical protein